MSVLPHVCVGDPSALALSRVRSAADQDQAFAIRRAAARRRHPNHGLRAL